ncbi:cellulose binding domain-containing protein [Phytohabitans aurantiacus]|uniref:CBM2 domain-containing protein n=1 Tax=Phytohabitans aurantiacus TaxID=3016789 RepID=A0ABQ5R7B2_9ACTN|nr:cellulose binding domain-containing protein [Phytohabitans aurantiacus]GLI01865.1 hypothetical protein Pa4123_71420 [Phytohabitans aurantiacus]
MTERPTRPRRTRRLALGVTAVLLALFAVPVAATNAYAVTRCDATYRVVAFWPPPPTNTAGFQAEITVTNSGSVKTTGWRIELTMPVGFITVTSYWNATKVPPRPADFENMSHNGVLNPGGSTSFGFIAVNVAGSKRTPNQFFCTAYSLENT